MAYRAAFNFTPKLTRVPPPLNPNTNSILISDSLLWYFAIQIESTNHVYPTYFGGSRPPNTVVRERVKRFARGGIRAWRERKSAGGGIWVESDSLRLCLLYLLTSQSAISFPAVSRVSSQMTDDTPPGKIIDISNRPLEAPNLFL